MNIPDPLPLRSIPVPPEVTAVAGCDCGGLDWHRDICTIWGVPHANAIAAVANAKDRKRAFTDALNVRLHEALGQ